MSAPIPDKFASTARLPVKLTDGVWTLFDGTALPKMKADTIAELLISPWNIIDKAERERLLKEHDVEFLAAGASVWARVKENGVPSILTLDFKTKRVWPNGSGNFVEIKLVSAVGLVIRGDGRASLTDCTCGIPALPEQECASINEAYTRISEAFEPSRRSHTGNIFNCVFYANGNLLYPLRHLRDAKLSTPPSAPSK